MEETIAIDLESQNLSSTETTGTYSTNGIVHRLNDNLIIDTFPCNETIVSIYNITNVDENNSFEDYLESSNSYFYSTDGITWLDLNDSQFDGKELFIHVICDANPATYQDITIDNTDKIFIGNIPELIILSVLIFIFILKLFKR